MSAQTITELRDFHRYLSQRLSNGEADLSPEQVLDEWRGLNPDSGALDEDVAAIQEALDDMAGGDKGIPFEEFDREFRARHSLPAKS
jgi:hypothetical protein